MPDTDPNQVRLTGENSFIRLLEAADGPQLTRVSHWRILFSPAGAGHARAGGAQWPRRGRPTVPPAAGRPGREHRLPGPLRDVGSPVTP